jgi:hypothetical protein
MYPSDNNLFSTEFCTSTSSFDTNKSLLFATNRGITKTSHKFDSIMHRETEFYCKSLVSLHHVPEGEILGLVSDNGQILILDYNYSSGRFIPRADILSHGRIVDFIEVPNCAGFIVATRCCDHGAVGLITNTKNTKRFLSNKGSSDIEE